MKITIERKVFSKFEDFHLGVVLLRGISNSGSDRKIASLMEEVADFIRLNFSAKNKSGSATISPMQAALRDFGETPIKFHSSVEGMMKAILAGRKLERASKLEDCISYVSLKNIAPISGYDLKSIGSIALGVSGKSEVVISDGKKVIARGKKISERARLSASTKDAVVLFSALPPITKPALLRIMAEFRDVAEMFCGGSYASYVLGEKQPEIMVK
ncbi:hypothetical protein HY638_04085 [Candidatus Woesearchaeota archaeon]|nr:hypothetical protein [Candidatus Woesearchaeota archaeon]